MGRGALVAAHRELDQVPTTSAATELSMIVASSSLDSQLHFQNTRDPAIRRANQHAACKEHYGCKMIGRWMAYPSQAAIAAPNRYCPSCPMLNNPERKATTADNPVRMTGVARSSVVINRQLPYLSHPKPLENRVA